jgi:ribosomal protein S18 acetylase RimI-like enzyme
MASELSAPQIVAAETPDLIPHVRALFLEYAESLGFDLCFQGFKEELAGLPGLYAPPRGRLYLADVGGAFVGSIGLRPMDEAVCEMKRLYVKPAFRGHGIARAMVYQLITDAKRIGYERMYLDTIETMAEAMALYRSVGFEECQPYSYHPVPGTRCFSLMLNSGL